MAIKMLHSGKLSYLILLSFLVNIPGIFGNLNLYLTNAEVKRLLGLKAEIYYVREGVVNEYAMSWNVPIPADVDALHFTWVAKDKKPLLYNLAIWKKESEEKAESADKAKAADKHQRNGATVLANPYVNIPLTGAVPKEPTTFTLYLPCTGAVSAIVDVTLNINFTSSRPKDLPTELYMKRRKICLEGQSSEMYSPHLDPIEDTPGLLRRGSFYYGVCGAGAFSIVIVSIICAAYVRKRMRIKRHREHCSLTSNCGGEQKTRSVTASTLLSPTITNYYTPTNHNYTPSTHTYTLPSSNTSNCYASLTQLPVTPAQASSRTTSSSNHTLPKPPRINSIVSLGPSSPPKSSSGVPSRDCTLTTACGAGSRDSTLNKRELLVDPCTALLQENYKHLQVDRRRVKLTCVLIEGRYGRLYRGCIQSDSPHPDTQVIVKTVESNASQQHVRQLCRDAVRLSSVQHRCLLPLAAVSIAPSSPPLFIFPDMGFHNLKLYLRGRGVHLTPGDLQQVALQAAQGLSFLHSCNILHTDVATRNCVINDQLQLRLTDKALCPDLFPEDYHPVGGDAPKPIAWLSLEAICDGTASQSADVWSWGILAWELCTLGQQPYQDIATAHIPDYLRDGYRLSQPPTCPDVLYQLMAFCWAINPSHRPRAALLVEYLLGLHQQQPSGFCTLPSSLSGADGITSSHIPASSFLHNSASVGNDLKKLNNQCSVSVGGDIKGLTHQFHSHSSLFTPSLPTPESKGLSTTLAPVYSKPVSVIEEESSSDVSVFTSGVYTTPRDVQADSWKSPKPPNGSISVPPPLPPANGIVFPPPRNQRPQQPLPNPNTSNSIIL